MTRKERDVIQKFINRESDYRKDRDKLFKDLQELNATKGTGTRWCSAQSNYEDLRKCGQDYSGIYEAYVELGAQIDLITELGQSLANIGFWDKKGD